MKPAVHSVPLANASSANHQITMNHALSGGSRGRRLGQLPRAPKRGEQKITRICMTKNVIDFIILSNQMFRINDIDIYNKNQYSVALH